METKPGVPLKSGTLLHLSDRTRGYCYGIIGVIIFGLTLPMTRIAVNEFPAIFVGLGRSMIAAILAAAYLLAIKASWPTRQQFRRLIFVPLGIVFGFPALSAIAMKTAPASHGGVVLGILPLATAAAASLVAQEKPSLAFWIWGMVGAAAVIVFSLLDGGAGFYGADILLLGAVVSAALGYALSGDLARQMGGLEVVSWALIISSPALFVLTLFYVDSINWSASLSAWGAFTYVAIFSQFLGFAFWNKGLALGGISHVGQTQLLQVFITLLASSLLLQEAISATTILFALIVVFAIFMGRKAHVSTPAHIAKTKKSRP